MYGLPQAGIIAQELLQKRLAAVGYHQSQIIPGLWTHKTRNICFTLVVDDFAIKYTTKEDAQHLVNALEKDYTISIDWDTTKYIGLTIDWDYMKRKVYIHMPGYLAKALQRFKHPTPKRQTLPQLWSQSGQTEFWRDSSGCRRWSASRESIPTTRKFCILRM